MKHLHLPYTVTLCTVLSLYVICNILSLYEIYCHSGDSLYCHSVHFTATVVTANSHWTEHIEILSAAESGIWWSTLGGWPALSDWTGGIMDWTGQGEGGIQVLGGRYNFDRWDRIARRGVVYNL